VLVVAFLGIIQQFVADEVLVSLEYEYNYTTLPRVRITASEEAQVASLQNEIEELKQLLEARTQAFRQARDQLPEVRIQISEISQNPSTSRRIEPLDDRTGIGSKVIRRRRELTV
jgi:chromosome segregation ATPase